MSMLLAIVLCINCAPIAFAAEDQSDIPGVFARSVKDLDKVAVISEEHTAEYDVVEYESYLSGSKVEVEEKIYNDGKQTIIFRDSVAGLTNTIDIIDNKAFVNGNEAKIIAVGERAVVPLPTSYVETKGPKAGAVYSKYYYTQKYNVLLGIKYADMIFESFVTLMGMYYPPCSGIADASSELLYQYFTKMQMSYENEKTCYVLAHVYTTPNKIDSEYEYYMFKNYFFTNADYEVECGYVATYCYLDTYIGG